MALTTKKISSFILSVSVNVDATRILLTLEDGKKVDLVPLPPPRFCAIVATLQASTPAYYMFDDVAKKYSIASSPDVPG